MADRDGIEALGDGAEGLENSLNAAAGMAAVFDGELRRVRDSLAVTGQDVKTLEKGLSRGLRKAFDGVIFGGMNLSDALETVARSMINTTYSAAMKPVTDGLGTVIANGVGNLVAGLMPFEKGAGFAQGRVMPFASGGVVTGPVTFPMRGGMGLMGEAGPEAIMPLARGRDGKLGVRGAGGGTVNVVMNVSTPDAQSFQRSQSQLAASMSRALGRGSRNR